LLAFQFISTTSNVLSSSKGNQIKTSNIFDQARTFSERSHAKKKEKKDEARNFSDSDSDSDAEKRKQVK